MRRSRLTRFLVFVALLVLGLGVGLDVVALQLAQSRASAGFAQATAAERATIKLGGFPFVIRLLAGRISRIEVHAIGLSGGGLRIGRLNARMQDLGFSPAGAISLIRSAHAARTRVTADVVVAQAEILEKDLNDFLRSRVRDFHDLRILPSGIEVRFTLPDGTTSPPARFLPRIVDGHLVLRVVGEVGVAKVVPEATRAAIEKAIELPAVPPGLTVEPTLGNGSFTIEASSPRLRLLVGEDGIIALPADRTG
jgi:hypothetical protein